jgi:hypothetical protein
MISDTVITNTGPLAFGVAYDLYSHLMQSGDVRASFLKKTNHPLIIIAVIFGKRLKALQEGIL